MELRQFTYVDMVAACGSFTKAAAKLFISQPALSNYIGKVEEELGVKLFDRSSTPLTLTYAGEQYLKRARVILGQIHEMDKEIRDITQNMKGKIRLGFPSERIIYMLPLLLAPFKGKYPGIDVEVITGPGNKLTEGLRAGGGERVFVAGMSAGSGKEGGRLEEGGETSIHHPEKRSCPSVKRGCFVLQYRCEARHFL